MCQELINAEKISGGEAGWHASEGFASEASNPVASSSKHIYFYKKNRWKGRCDVSGT